MTELQILSAVKNNSGSIGYVDLLNVGLSDPEFDALADRDLIRKLIASDVLSGKQEAYSTISFGKNGRLRLNELAQQEQERTQKEYKDRADKRAQHRHDWAVAIVGALTGVIGTLLVQLIIKLLFG